MSFFLNPALACDYYKIGHLFMQPPGSSNVYSTWTARSNKFHPHCEKTVVFGYQYTIQKLQEFWDENFFSRPLDELEAEYREVIGESFHPWFRYFDKFAALHKLGYLPLRICGVPEGTLLPVGIPSHTIENTDPDFAWLPQFIEDQWSTMNWMPSTSATTAYYRRKLLEPYVNQMCDNPATLDHMCGDFSMRGHSSMEAAITSGAGHLLSFDRTATIGSNILVYKYYGAKLSDNKGTPSLEHSVVEQGVAWMKWRIKNNKIPDYCLTYSTKVEGWDENLVAEMYFILYLINEVCSNGVMTYVADTYDYWGVVTKILPTIKLALMKRNGTFSVRPDSGNPVHIICGNPNAETEHERKGTLRLLLETFGSETNDKGYEVLPPYIRMIYGDAITYEITQKVCDFCLDSKISIENICFGIGAYTYQYVTRDTRCFAIKATHYLHEDFGETPIYKAPKTDSGKKSPKGCVAVIKDENGEYKMIDNLKWCDTVDGDIFEDIFFDGDMLLIEDFDTIKMRLRKE